MGIVHTTCVPNSAHYTGLAWSVVASFPGDIAQLNFCSHVGNSRQPGNEATTAAQVLFRLDRVKQITDHSEEVDVTGYHTVGMC